MKYGIVIDSGCDLRSLSLEDATQADFTLVPMNLDIGNQNFVDDEKLDISTFMREMYAYKGKTGSAAPSPAAYLEAFEKSENVFCINITARLSGSHASASVAADIFRNKHPERNLCVIDSCSAGPEMTLFVRKIIECIRDGYEFDAIVSEIEKYRQHTHLFFVLQSITNLVKNGRVGKIAGSVAGILGIKALGVASEVGEIDLLQKHRGKLKIYDCTIAEMLKYGYDGGKIIMSHCFNSEIVDYISRTLREKFPACSIEVTTASGLCSYYAEQGGILIAFET